MSRPGEDFARLFVRHEQELYRYALTLMARHADAEDVVQEAAAEIWRKFDEYDPQRPFLPWAAKFVYFQALSRRRSEKVRRRYFSEATLEALADDRVRHQELLAAQRKALDSCMQRLKPGERELIQTRYGEDQTVIELARRTGRPVTSMYMALTRLRRKLVVCLNRRLAGESGS